jgi:hypothetical protein
MNKKSHHQICGACSTVSIEHSPQNFPLPGDIAEEILSDSPDLARTHHLIAKAIAERDKMHYFLRMRITSM